MESSVYTRNNARRNIAARKVKDKKNSVSKVIETHVCKPCSSTREDEKSVQPIKIWNTSCTKQCSPRINLYTYAAFLEAVKF